MRLKVEMGHGRSKPARVTTEDGELIEGVVDIDWHADANDRPKFKITLVAERVEIDLGEEEGNSEQETASADREPIDDRDGRGTDADSGGAGETGH